MPDGCSGVCGALWSPLSAPSQVEIVRMQKLLRGL